MINAFYTATSGAKTSQNSIDVSANNLANVNTTGYKAQSASFSDVLYTNINGGSTSPQNLQTGGGSKLQEISKVLTQGIVEGTGNALDVSIEGDGFFAVSDSNGNIKYTRAGNFMISNDGNNSLTTANGDFVLDQNLSKITINTPVEDIVFSVGTGQNNPADITTKLGIFTFNNNFGLQVEGEGKYSESNLSGQATLYSGATIKQGSLEISNVDMSSEMTKMIEAQRSFQFNAKMIQVADEIEQISNTLRS